MTNPWQVNAQTRRDFWHAIAAFDNLPDGFFPEFRCKSLGAHERTAMLKG